MNTRSLHTVLAVALMAFALSLLILADSAHAARSYRLAYSFTPSVSANNGLWIPVPKLWDGQGVVDAQLVSVSPDTGAESDEQCGNKSVAWPDSDLNKQLTVTFDVELSPVTLPVNPSTSWGGYNSGTQEYQFNTVAVWGWVQSDDSAIINRASSIVGGTTNPYTKANAIYAWVRDNISYQDGVRQDALTALSQRKGDCASYAILFVALCRAQGIPARNVSGFLAHDQFFNVATQFSNGSWNHVQWPRGFSTHVWAEFMLPDGTWVQVDPTHGLFGAIPFERIILSKGNDILLGWMNRPWFHLPVDNSQVNNSTVTLSITYLGTDGIEHPDPPEQPAAFDPSAMQLLLFN